MCCRHVVLRDKHHRVQAQSERHAGLDDAALVVDGRHAHTAQQTRHHVVGVTLERRRQVQELGFAQRPAQAVIGNEDAAGDGRRAAAQTARKRDAIDALQLEAGVWHAHLVEDRTRRAVDERLLARILGQARVSRNLVPQVQRQAQAIESRPHVGARGRRAHDDRVRQVRLVRGEGRRPGQLLVVDLGEDLDLDRVVGCRRADVE